MSKAVLLTSLKGGVGKTTVCAGIAFCAAFYGKRVLAVDLDLGICALDIALGAENSAAPDICEVLCGRAQLSDALVCVRENLCFVAAGRTRPDAEEIAACREALASFLAQAKALFDLVLLDLPAGGGDFLKSLCANPQVDLALIVTTEEPTALRAAEETGFLLAAHGVKDEKLIVNRYEPKRAQRGLYGIIRETAVPLLGVVPEEKLAARALSAGVPLSALPQSGAGRALFHITLRIFGAKIPLLRGILAKRARRACYRRP